MAGLEEDHALIEKARSGKLIIDYADQKRDWTTYFFRRHVKLAADHYGVFQDLYDFGFFYPTKVLQVGYPVSDGESAPVHLGNIIVPAETRQQPEVRFEAEPGELYTLVMTSLDAHLELDNMEYLHWMVGNIPGNDVSKGVSVCDYMQPFVPKGAGYHRFVFVLYKQDKQLDFAKQMRTPNTVDLRERNFRTLDWYREHQDRLTPCGLAFFQSKWDDSLVHFFHHVLDMKVPVFEHVPLPEPEPVFQKYPEGLSFNEYIDQFRDPKEIAEDIYQRRLKKLDPFQEEAPPLKYPHARRLPVEMANWLKREVTQERDQMGKFAHMKRFSLYPQPEKKPYRKVLKPGEEP